jgi:hypothetical protein
MTFEIKVFRDDRAEPVDVCETKDEKEAEAKILELVRKHRLGEFSHTPEPGVHAYINGTIHARKL